MWNRAESDRFACRQAGMGRRATDLPLGRPASVRNGLRAPNLPLGRPASVRNGLRAPNLPLDRPASVRNWSGVLNLPLGRPRVLGMAGSAKSASRQAREC